MGIFEFPAQQSCFIDEQTEAQEVSWTLEPDMENMFYAIEYNLALTIIISYICNI